MGYMCMRTCLYRAMRKTPDASVTFWGQVLSIYGRTPYGNGTQVVDEAIGQVTTWDMDSAWALDGLA